MGESCLYFLENHDNTYYRSENLKRNLNTESGVHFCILFGPLKGIAQKGCRVVEHLCRLALIRRIADACLRMTIRSA
jgi:hypothetical protein